jgi:threonine 3-dehydrogenase
MPTLITGGTGFIGSQVARVLAERGERPVVFDINDRPIRFKGIEDKVTIVRGDVSNYSHVFNVVKQYGIDGIYHLGSMLSVSSDADPWSAFQVNAQGSFHVLEAARILGVKKVLFSSTLGTYGLDVREAVIDDYTLQRPTLFYGCTKVFVELMGRFYRRKRNRFPGCLPSGDIAPASNAGWSSIIPGRSSTSTGASFKTVTPESRSAMYYKDAALGIIQCARLSREYQNGGLYPGKSVSLPRSS